MRSFDHSFIAWILTLNHNYFPDHLECLVHTKRLSEILNIFPVKYIGDNIDQDNGEIDDAANDPSGIADRLNHSLHLNGVDGDDRHRSMPIKNSDYAFFTKYLKKAIDLDRSERLSEMIKTTGVQLYNSIAVNNLNAETIDG